MEKSLSLIFIAVVALIINGCGGGGGGIEDSDLVTIQTLPFPDLHGVNGRSDIIGAAYVEVTAGSSKRLNIYQQNSGNPDELLEWGSVYLGNDVDVLYTMINDVTLSQDWATVVVNGTGYPGYDDGYVALVSLQNHPNYSLGSLMVFSGVYVDRAIAMEDWLVVASGATLQVFDISSVTAPILAGTFSSAGDSTSMVSVPSGFYVFTTAGYVHVDYSNPTNVTFTDVSSADLKQTKKVYAVGNKLYIGGPSIVAGNIRIGRVDVSVPANPVLDFTKNDIAGNYVDFSIDGTDYYVMTSNMLLRYIETGGNFSLDKSAGYSYEVRIGDNSQLYTWNSRIYTLEQFGGLSISIFQ